ncbi:MAG: LrgB family protein [Acidobacteriaceae bacterium]|jgi:predicted murein hydrolase (TIGR00659 family)|nr:LrgB family protein [Acidobacteriaceae bacterium]
MSMMIAPLHTPVFAVAITVVLYWISLRVQGRYPWANPLITASVALVLALYVLRIPYAQYRIGGNYFSYLLGPATIALGVPMYKQGVKLKGSLRRLMVVVLAGSIVGMVVAGVVAWMLGASHEVIMSTLPKSVTTPIAIQVSEDLHGNPAITAAMVLITGLLGSIVGPSILRLAHILHDHAVGAAMGTSSHAMGTATLIQRSEVQGSVSSIAMAMAGVITSILAMLLTWYWH